VFLRVLEYLSGILFLTTDRVGSFDETLKSRIHISLHYPELSRKQSRKIWETNIARTRRIDAERTQARSAPAMLVDERDILAYADEHYATCASTPGGLGKWNGRQIRNAFQTATAIALYEAHKDNARRRRDDAASAPLPPHLRRKHFEEVARATLQFDGYIKETVGKTDEGAAYARGDRADHFQPLAYAAPATAYGPPPPGPSPGRTTSSTTSRSRPRRRRRWRRRRWAAGGRP
jgi:hypothetical protein